MPVGDSMTTLSGVSALAAAAIAPPPEGVIPLGLEDAVRQACAGAWRAIEVVLAGDVLRGRLSKTRDTIVREAASGVLELFGNVGIRADALAALRAAREAGALDDALDIASIVDAVRTHGAVAVGRGAVGDIRRALVAYRELDAALADHELASLLIDAARACFRGAAHDPALAAWAIGPTGSPGRDRALAAFAELADSPESLDELETLIAVPIHLDDNVQFTVYRPRTIDPGKWHQLLAFAHLADRRPGEADLPDPVEEVQRQAASVLGKKAQDYQPVIQDSGSAIPEEGELTFVPEFPGIEVNPPRRSFLWLETVHREEFRIRAGRDLHGKTVRGRMTVFLGHIAIAEVALSVRVDAEPRTQDKVREPQHARAYRKIFASYSHRDIDVVNQFETYARALGDEYLRDWVHLRTGEVWTDRLCQLIEHADAFQLFWSRNSMHSKFVRQEYEHALSLGRPSFVRPTYWEEPMPTAPGLPPESLLRLHFQKLGAEMAATVGAGSRSEQPVIARKKRAREPDFDSMEREHAHDSDTKKTLAREAVREEAIDSWDAETDQDQANRLRAARPSTDVDEVIDPGDSFSETRKDISPAPPRAEPHAKFESAKRLTTQPGPGTSADECPSCGGTNDISAAFCRNCGFQLAPDARNPLASSGAASAAHRAPAGKSMKSDVRPPRPTESSPAPGMPPPSEPPAPSRAVAARPASSMPPPMEPPAAGRIPAPPSAPMPPAAGRIPAPPSASMPPAAGRTAPPAAPMPSMAPPSAPRPAPSPSSARAQPPRPAESSPLPESITTIPGRIPAPSPLPSAPSMSSPRPAPGPSPSFSRAQPPPPTESRLPEPPSSPAEAPLRATMPAPSTPLPTRAPMPSSASTPSTPLPSHGRAPAPPSARPPMASRPAPMAQPGAQSMSTPLEPMDSWTDESPPAPELDASSHPDFAPDPLAKPPGERSPTWVDEEDVAARSPTLVDEPDEVPRPAPSPDSWSDEDWPEQKEASARPRRASMPPAPSPFADAKPSLFPPGPPSRPSPAPSRTAMANPAAPRLFPQEPIAPEQQPMTSPPAARQRISSPSQPPPAQPITTTLPGVVLTDDAPVRPSSPAIMPPMSSPAIVPPPMAPLSSPAQPDAVPPVSPASATMLAPTPPPSATMLAPTPNEAFPEDAPSIPSPGAAAPQSWLKRSDGALPFAATVPQQAYDPTAEDLKLMGADPGVAKVGMPNFSVGSVSHPEAPASRGWILAVLLVLIVAAIVVLLIVL